jgi:hypothetical protein
MPAMPTRIAISSDLHGNVAAGEAVLAAIDAAQPDAVYCLGTWSGTAPSPTRRPS